MRIIWFHAYNTRQDVDNIAKRILDALDGVVYASDFLVVKCAIEKVHYTREDYDIVPMDAPHDVYEELLRAIGATEPDVLFIHVDVVGLRRVVLGRIDGGVE